MPGCSTRKDYLSTGVCIGDNRLEECADYSGRGKAGCVEKPLKSKPDPKLGQETLPTSMDAVSSKDTGRESTYVPAQTAANETSVTAAYDYPSSGRRGGLVGRRTVSVESGPEHGLGLWT